jgi:hypothetical protein
MVVNAVGRIIVFNLKFFPLVCPLQTFTFLDPKCGSKLPGMLQDPWYMLLGIYYCPFVLKTLEVIMGA